MRYTGLGSEALVGLKRLQVDVVRKGLRVVVCASTVGMHAKSMEDQSSCTCARTTTRALHAGGLNAHTSRRRHTLSGLMPLARVTRDATVPLKVDKMLHKGGAP
jgi:hypothetical protein